MAFHALSEEVKTPDAEAQTAGDSGRARDSTEQPSRAGQSAKGFAVIPAPF